MALLFQTFATPNRFYAFDGNTNSVLAVSKEQFLALCEIQSGSLSSKNIDILESFQKKGFLREANIEAIEHPCSSTLGEYHNRRVEKVTLQLTQKCNLRCGYCAYSGMYENRTHSPRSMSLETATQAIDLLLSHSGDLDEVNLGFYGGEPLLEFELVRQCIAYAEKVGKGKKISYSMTTNGTLLTPEIFEFCISKGINVLLSLDGPEPMHNKFRKFPDGRGSYDTIMANLSRLQELYPDDVKKISINAVISSDSDDSCLPSYFKMEDVDDYYRVSMSMLSDTYLDTPNRYSDAFYAANAQEQCMLLLSMIGKVSKSKVSRVVRRAEAAIIQEYKLLRPLQQLPAKCHPGGPCLAGVLRLFVNIDGDLYPCERVSELSIPMHIGNVAEGIDTEKARALINVGKLTEQQCKSCWAILHCGMCAAYADDTKNLTAGKRLANCAQNKYSFLARLKKLCFLKENGYNFDVNE